MLFIAHSAATAANAGKIYFTKNPMAINYPQWIAFAKYSYSQLKWGILAKPMLREAYVSGKLSASLKEISENSLEFFNRVSSEYTVVFNKYKRPS